MVGFEPICVGAAPALAAIMPHIPSYGGEEGREGGVWNCARKPASIEAVTLVRRKIATFLRVFRTIKLVFHMAVHVTAT